MYWFYGRGSVNLNINCTNEKSCYSFGMYCIDGFLQ